MRKKLKLLPVVFLLVSLISSCGKNGGVTLSEITAEAEPGQDTRETEQARTGQQSPEPAQQSSETAQQSLADLSSGSAQSQQPGQSGQPDSQQPSASQQPAPTTLYIYVCGAVVTPGVYELPPGSRICDALESAGGFTERADINRINLAGTLTDGMMIFFPEVGEEMPEGYEIAAGTATGQTPVGEKTDSGLVNINTAGVEDLCTLPGIGESKAKAVVEYREEHGPFAAKEEIMNVSGIGTGLYKKIEDLICV